VNGPLFQQLLGLLQEAGPWLVLLVTATETAFFIGLLIPAEATVLVAAFLAYQGYFRLEHVLAATLVGAFVGDQLGYLLGRFGGHRVAASSGRVGRLWRRYDRMAQQLFRRRSILAVTVARFISFVRTLMPWFAGMSRMPYGRYVVFDALGVVGWGGLSVLAGYAAGGSWHIVADALGALSAALLGLLAVLAGGAWLIRRRRARPLRVGLTGNIGSGKSAVAAVWERLGGVVVDADELARLAVARGSPGYEAVRRHFGERVLAADGDIDRAALRQLVFADAAERRVLEDIVHPEVERLRLERERALAGQGVRLVVHMIPLLFETAMEDRFDEVVLVDAPAELRRERIVSARGLRPDEAAAMIAAQEPSATKRQLATRVIDNAGTLEELERAAEEVWRELMKRAAGA
jgi:dephospho-CoA kinase